MDTTVCNLSLTRPRMADAIPAILSSSQGLMGLSRPTGQE